MQKHQVLTIPLILVGTFVLTGIVFYALAISGMLTQSGFDLEPHEVAVGFVFYLWVTLPFAGLSIWLPLICSHSPKHARIHTLAATLAWAVATALMSIGEVEARSSLDAQAGLVYIWAPLYACIAAALIVAVPTIVMSNVNRAGVKPQ